MGSLTVPSSGDIYADTQTTIYTVQNHPVYASVCRPLWQAARIGRSGILSSELTLLETLVVPIRDGDTALQSRFERFLLHSDVNLLPITQSVLREAARLRAEIRGLKAPDAIHAATALLNGCTLFVTNDTGFRRVPGLSPVILNDVLAVP